MDESTEERKEGGIHGMIAYRNERCMKGRKLGRKDGWIDGWMDAWEKE